MTLNCKPGDLAFVNRGLPSIPDELLGQIVRVVSISPTAPDIWKIEEPIKIILRDNVIDASGYRLPAGTVIDVDGLPDECLTPIRPTDEPDETLTWAPVSGQLEVV